MLTAAERDLIARAFAQGPSALIDEGFTPDEIAKFVMRQDVQAQLAMLKREMDVRQELEERTRHLTRRQMSRLTPGAVAILAQALAGPQYLTYEKDGQRAITTDANGNPVLLRAEVLPSQLRAAEVVLETLGVGYGKAKNEISATTTGDVSILFKSPEAVPTISVDDPSYSSDAQRALSRERVRTVISVLSGRVPQLHENLKANLGITATPAASSSAVKKKARRVPAKAKAPKGGKG